MIGLVIVPAFNEARVIGSVLANIPKAIDGIKLDILVVNDGSTDNTDTIVSDLKVNIVSHPINRGLGAALGTGFEYARRHGYEMLITLDADGQHDPQEVKKLVLPIINQTADFVIGSRTRKKGMPVTRQIITFMASLITLAFTGVWTTDSQSGFRAFSKKAIGLIDIEVDRMEVSSEFFKLAKDNNLKFMEVPITPIYTKYSLQKGQNFFNSVNIVGKLFLQRLMR